MDYYIFNGDADGIIAARIFHGDGEGKGRFITGVKRDTSLLKQLVHLSDLSIWVFDISVEKNIDSLKKLLEKNCMIKWFDHHVSADIPNHRKFLPVINTDSNINTTWLVSNHQKRFTPWTVAGLFGDSMVEKALNIGKAIDLNEKQIGKLKEFGELLNYNAYGEKVEDLYYSPVGILKQSFNYSNIFDFINQTDIYEILSKGRAEDLQKALKAEQIASGIILFPNTAWAKRVIGDYANALSKKEPDLAHAVLVENKEGDFVVSVRSAINQEKNVAAFCSQFPTGGGRIKAGGINKLSQEDLASFISAFIQYFNH